MMSHIRNIALLVCLLILIGVGAFLYFTRPIVQPRSQQPVGASSDVQQASEASIVEQSPSVPNTASNSVISFAIDRGTSESSFTISEVLRGTPFMVTGKTRNMAGTISIDFSDPSHSFLSPIIIDARTFHTDDSRRDGAIGRLILRAEDPGNEQIVFVPKTISGLPKAFAAGIPFSATIMGDLTIAGITKPAEFTAMQILVNPDMVTGEASARIKRSDYNLIIPTLPFVADVPDEFTVQLHLKAVVSQ